MVIRRGLLWSLVAATAFAAVAVLAVSWFRDRLTRPDEWNERIQGNWQLHHMRWAGSHSLHSELIYGADEIVASNVHAWKYYGDDCLAYGSSTPEGEHYFFVCGRRRPVVIGGDAPTSWTFDGDVVRERGIESNSTAVATGARVLRVSELKSAAFHAANRVP